MLKSYVHVVLSLVCLLTTHLSNAVENDKIFDLQIPSSQASVALKVLAHQTKYSLLFQNAEIEAVMTNAVNGHYTLIQALDILLKGTNLSSGVTGGRVIAISLLPIEQKKQLEVNVKKVNKKSLLNRLSIFMLSVFGANGHAAQDDEGVNKGIGLEEIVVTARYKEESLQETPISITVFSASMLEARGITEVTDIAASAPNVSMAPGGARNGKAAVAFIRGVGQFDSSFAYEPGVGMYVDDVYYQTLFGSQFALGDIDSIQILRGPQGTLFGKNTEGGAVVVNMVDPSGDGSGYIKLGYGNYNRRQVKAAFDVSLIEDKLFMRASYGSENQDGYVDLIDYPCAFPSLAGSFKATTTGGGCQIGTQGSVDVQTGRVAFKLLATDDLTIRFSADVLQDRADGPPDVLVGIPQPDRIAGYNASTVVPTFGIPYDERFLPPDNYTSYQSFTNPFNGTTTPNIQTMESWGATLKFDWDLPNNMHFKSITAYREYAGKSGYNVGQSPVPISLGLIDSTHEQFSQEIRLNGDAFNGALEWTVGGYYSSGESWLGGFYDVASFNFPFDIDDVIPQKSKALFAHALYSITDKLSLELGLRYSDDWKKYTFDHAFFPNGPNVFPVTAAVTESTDVDPKIGLQYQLTPDLMTYVQYSTGYKAGGINGHPNTPATVVPFDPETLKAYEVGIKSEWFDHRVRINAAAFYNDFKDLQLVVFVPGETGGLQSNAGHAVIKGVEVDVQAEPIENLQIDMGLGFLDFEYKDLGGAAFDPVNNPGGPRMGDIGAYTPEFKGYLGLQYTMQLDDKGRLIPRLDYSYQSKIYFDQQNVDFASQDGYGVFNARLTWEAADETWSGALEVRNVTDKFYWVNMANLSGNWGSLGGTPSMPRTFFFSLRRNF